MGHFQEGEKANFVALGMISFKRKSVFQQKSIIFVSQGFRNMRRRRRKEHRSTKWQKWLFLCGKVWVIFFSLPAGAQQVLLCVSEYVYFFTGAELSSLYSLRHNIISGLLSLLIFSLISPHLPQFFFNVLCVIGYISILERCIVLLCILCFKLTKCFVIDLILLPCLLNPVFLSSVLPYVHLSYSF